MDTNFILGFAIGIFVCIVLLTILNEKKPDLVGKIIGGLKNVKERKK